MLLECTGKLVSKLIAARLQLDAVHFNLVHPLQFGGLKYHSTVDAGFFLTEYIVKAWNAGRHASALALDIAQFFPSLHCDVIMLMMCKLGFLLSYVSSLILITRSALPNTFGMYSLAKTMTLTMVSPRVTHFSPSLQFYISACYSRHSFLALQGQLLV